jgi:hypothetical protein
MFLIHLLLFSNIYSNRSLDFISLYYTYESISRKDEYLIRVFQLLNTETLRHGEKNEDRSIKDEKEETSITVSSFILSMLSPCLRGLL